MAGTKEILGSLRVNIYSSEPLSNSILNSHYFHQKTDLSFFTTSLSLVKRGQMQLKKVVATPVAPLIESESSIKARAEIPVKFKVTAMVTVRNNIMEIMKELMLQWLYSDRYPTQKGVVLQLVSTEIDLRTMEPKLSKEAILEWPKILNIGAREVTYKVEFWVDSNFGIPGAITVSNKYQREFYLDSINIEGVVHFACNSWVQPDTFHSEKRIFFSNKAYLPSETPLGLKELREKELRQLRGDGKGLRLLSDRIYDYDVYNDLGDPDKGIEFARPTLGGENYPYPRRCRTGRPPTKTDSTKESPVNEFIPMYVPRDEVMEETKKQTLFAGKLKGILNNLIPYLKTVPTNCDAIKGFSDIQGLYKRRPSLEVMSHNGFSPLPMSFGKIKEYMEDILKFDPPKPIYGDNASCCLQDDELGRLVLAGMNPLSIERLKVFPPVSKLDLSIYGPQESALREEHIIGHLNGMSIQQALEENKLFILDHHDTYLPFLSLINALSDRKAYATRTIFFLTSVGTLKPIAIELSLPPMDSNSPSKDVLTPPIDATTNWLWQLGKAHVCSNDAGAHQFIHHWLRTHACMEPFIIAAHRQLSVMHPIYKLLDPHMRYTLDINAQARELLINSGGIIESCFSAGKYGTEITEAAYQHWWRFDLEGLPADLIRRGMAIPDPTQAHGLRLLIDDYPYATDGLLIWSSIETLVKTYVNYYYPEPNLVQFDSELQAWYYESINMGHADLRHADWWPKLASPDDLASILTTIIWVVSAQHAALNYGQYPYGGYAPTRPPFLRRLLPKEDDPEYANFIANPQKYYLSSLPRLHNVTFLMSILDILSTHSPDDEYLGDRKDLSTWSGDPEIIEAFYKFSMEIKRIEKEIEKRNADPNNRNRCGAGVSPYELLMPSSGPGITCRGVPNSVSL